MKICLLVVAVMIGSVYADAQSAHNPLNRKPASLTLQKGISAKKPIDMTYYRADGTPFDKFSLTYDESGRRVEDLARRWNGAWQDVSKYNYIYEEDKMTVVSSLWRAEKWSVASKTEYYYNSEGKKAYSLYYLWNNANEDWSKPAIKEEWTYDKNGRMTEYQESHINTETMAWNDCSARIIYSYDNEGNLSEELYKSVNMQNGLWADGGKCIYSANGKGEKTVASYNYIANKWLPDGKSVYIYDNEGNIIRSEHSGSKDEAFSAYCIYTYSDAYFFAEEFTAGDINVYPNPVVSSFELTVPAALVGNTASLFDLSGQPVKSIAVSSETVRVDVSGLSKGVYFLKIADKTKTFVIK